MRIYSTLRKLKQTTFDKLFKRNQTFEIFLESRIEVWRYIIRWMRIGIGLPAVVYFCVVLPFAPPSNMLMLVGPPILVAAHLIITTLLLRRRFQWLCPYFMNFEICLFTILGVESIQTKDEGEIITGLMTGVEVMMLVSVLLVSKIPWRHLLISYLVFSCYLVWIAYGGPRKWINISFFLSISILLLCTYQKIEIIEYKTHLELDKRERSLLQYKKLIENFPNQIIIVDQDSYKNKTGFYMNNEAKKLNEKLGTNDLLENLMLAEFNIEEMRDNKSHINLSEKIEDLLCIKKEKSNVFYHFISTLKKNVVGTLEEINHNDIGNKNETNNTEGECLIQERVPSDKLGKKKFELILGNIEWGVKEDKEAIIIIFNDISNKEKIRELKLLHENKDRLLATVSHELRTPLNGLIGMLEQMNDEFEDKKLRKYVSIAKNSARALQFMINDILDTSQIQKGVLRLNFSNINIQELMNDILPLFQYQIKKKGLKLNFINKCHPLLTIRADKNRLQQIIFNLISNACKFTDEGEISVEVFQGQDEKKDEISEEDLLLDSDKDKDEILLNDDLYSPLDGENITIKVKDTGRGIKPEVVPELFKLFGKFEVRGNETGVGLGLAISQRLAKKMTKDGIEVKSEYGKGSEFWIKLTKGVFAESPEMQGRKKINESLVRNFSKPYIKLKPREMSISTARANVLVVDDDPINQMVIVKYLTAIEPLQIDRANNGLDALNLVKKGVEEQKFYNLIFMDCNMPIMDGFEATRHISSMIQNGVLPPVNIIAVTANVSASDKNSCLSCGMIDVLEKPLNKEEFLQKVKKYIIN